MEYGYDADSRKALKVFNACIAQREKLERVFDTEEVREAFAEIR